MDFALILVGIVFSCFVIALIGAVTVMAFRIVVDEIRSILKDM
jgi:hypothetical protein